MKLEDERVRFYLKHRAQIEEWIAIRDEAAAAIDEWLAGLQHDVEALGIELGNVQVEPGLDEDDAWPGFWLKRPSWPDDAVFVGLEWHRRHTMLCADSAPAVGVWSEKSTMVGQSLRQNDQFQAARSRRRDKASAWWPAYRYLLPVAPFPADADNYRRTLVESLRDAWNAYAGEIDRALAEG